MSMINKEENKEYFTTGQLAKMAKVSVRTIRFYDTDNILTEYRLKTFNSDMYYGLSGENANVFTVVNNSFTKFKDVVMNP